MGMILRIASSRIVGQGDIVGRSGYFSLNLSANSVMRGRLDARRTLKSLVADLRIFKRNNTYYENGLHLLSVFIRSCSLDFAYFYSVFLCFCNLVLSELWFLIISYPGQRYEIFISLYVFLLKKFIWHSFLTIQTYRLSTSIRQYQTFEPF